MTICGLVVRSADREMCPQKNDSGFYSFLRSHDGVSPSGKARDFDSRKGANPPAGSSPATPARGKPHRTDIWMSSPRREKAAPQTERIFCPGCGYTGRLQQI